MESQFTKDNTRFVKGIAIICMILLHLFAYPERYGWSLDARIIRFTTSMQICVPIFLFMSGYGLQCVTAKSTSTWTELIKRIGKLYKTFWWCAIPFVVIALTVSAKHIDLEICKNVVFELLGVTTYHNGEWWFFSLYVELCLSFWFVSRIRVSWKKELCLMTVIYIALRALLKVWMGVETNGILHRHVQMLLTDFNIFWLGCFFAKNDLFGRMMSIKLSSFVRVATCIVCLCFPIIMRAYLPLVGVTELVHVPMFIVGCILLFNCKWLRKPVLLVGKYSTQMWLIHSWFIFYWANTLTIVWKNPIYMFAIVMAQAMLCSILIEKVRGIFSRRPTVSIR